MVLWVGLLPPEHVGPSAGPFAGIQFDNPVGKGNGSLGSTKYFVAREGYAAFVPAHMLHKVQADSHSLFSASYSPPSASSSSSSPPIDYYRQNGGGDDSNYSNGFSSPHLNNVGGGGGGNSINGVVSDIPRSAYMAPIGTRPVGGVVGGNGGYSAFDGLSSSPYLKSAYAANPAAYSNGASPAKPVMNGGDVGAANTPAATKNDDEVFESDDEIDEALKVSFYWQFRHHIFFDQPIRYSLTYKLNPTDCKGQTCFYLSLYKSVKSSYLGFSDLVLCWEPGFTVRYRRVPAKCGSDKSRVVHLSINDPIDTKNYLI